MSHRAKIWFHVLVGPGCNLVSLAQRPAQGPISPVRQTPEAMDCRFYEVTSGLSPIEEYMILSMEIPSKPQEIQDAVFPDVFVVGYVKVYSKTEAGFRPGHDQRE